LKSKKNILFTFDYELFLGQRSGSVSRCCIEPTQLLIRLFDEFGIKNAVFFVDTTHLLRLKEVDNPAAKADFASITAQLKLLVKKGHYVFPHIHPHWLDAVYLPAINQWDLSKDRRYRFSTLTDIERADLFTRSIHLLNEILKPVDANYKIDAYRAGGWCIQPFTDFIPSFEKHGITNDFSVLRGASNDSEKQHFNFTVAPSKDIYRFATDPLLEQTGNYTEYVISVLKITKSNQLRNKLLLKALLRSRRRSIGDGIGAASSGGKGATTTRAISEMASIELLTSVRLPVYLSYLKKHNYLHFISHPKMLSPYNIAVFKKFLVKFTRQHKFETDFRKMLPMP
jgi:hypothetical protein